MDKTNAQDALVSELVGMYQRLDAQRAVFASHWQEVAERVWPERGSFTSTFTEGMKKGEKIYDSTATLALTRFAAALESMITPRNAKWHGLRVPGELGQNDEVIEYLEAVNDALFAERYGAKANFSSQMYESYMSLGAFGSGCMFVEDAPGYGIRYKSVHLAELYFMENYVGAIDTVLRKFQLTAKQVAEKFDKTRIPENIMQDMAKTPEKKYEILHAVRPALEQQGWYSYYILVDKKLMLEEGRYYTFPYICGRYVTTPNEVYGRSPAMMVLPDIKTTNEMSKTLLRAAQLSVTPPLLASEDGVLQSFNMTPGALNFGGVDAAGNPTVIPMQFGSNFEVGAAAMQERRAVINDAFLVSLFQILVDKPYMTASEALLRAQEKGQLLAPTMGRIQSEMIGPMIERELDILARRGDLPQMPQVLAEAGGFYNIEFDAPLNRMMRAEEAVGIQRTFESALPLAQIDPSVMDRFDIDAIFEIQARANGMPQRGLRSDAEVAARKEQRAQAAQAQQMMQAVPVAAGAARDLASAAKTAQEAQLVGANQ